LLRVVQELQIGGTSARRRLGDHDLSLPESRSPPTAAVPDVTAALARFIVRTRYEDIPEKTRKDARRALVNSMAATLGGCRNDVIVRLTNSLLPFAGTGPSPLVGHDRKMDAPNAAFVNGASAGVLDFCDTHFPTVMHPSATVVGALYAFSGLGKLSGKDFLHAFILGFEAQARVGNSVTPHHYAHGYHITSSCGVFGSATAIGKLLGQDERRMIWTIGNASTQSAGMVKACGFMSKSIGVGNAAKNGLLAACYAEQDIDAPQQSLEGKFGYCAVMAPEPKYGAITEKLGETWEFDRNAFKAYPAGIVIHPVIDACLELRGRNITADRIAQVHIRGNPLMGNLTSRPVVETEREAVVSVQHSVAVAFIDGGVGVRQYWTDRVADPKVIALRDKVTFQPDPSLPVGPIRMALRTTDGVLHEAKVDHWRGSLERPLSDDDLEKKLAELAAIGAPHCDTRRLADMLWRIEDIGDVTEIVAATAPSGQV
jgi:2-methylcitrate dehydratase PrpD